MLRPKMIFFLKHVIFISIIDPRDQCGHSQRVRGALCSENMKNTNFQNFQNPFFEKCSRIQIRTWNRGGWWVGWGLVAAGRAREPS